jgi:hypothetical protein
LTATLPDEPKIDLNEEELRSELQQVEVGHALTKLDQEIADRRLHEALWIREVHELMSENNRLLVRIEKRLARIVQVACLLALLAFGLALYLHIG